MNTILKQDKEKRLHTSPPMHMENPMEVLQHVKQSLKRLPEDAKDSDQPSSAESSKVSKTSKTSKPSKKSKTHKQGRNLKDEFEEALSDQSASERSSEKHLSVSHTSTPQKHHAFAPIDFIEKEKTKEGEEVDDEFDEAELENMEAEEEVLEEKIEELKRGPKASWRDLGIIVHTLNRWIRAFRTRGNETVVRNRYYQLMFTLFFSQPDPIRAFLAGLESIRILPHNSTSQSVCFTGYLKPRPGIPKGLDVFVKLTTEYQIDQKYKEIEPRIYKSIVNPMVQERLTPHLMMYLGSVHVDHGIQSLTRLQDLPFMPDIISQFTTLRTESEAKFNTEYGIRSEPYPEGANLLVTECGKGITLDVFLDHYKPEQVDELYKILFQLFYTMMVMDLNQLTHYDLHMKNIFLEDLLANPRHAKRKPQTFVYFIENAASQPESSQLNKSSRYVTLPLGRYFLRIFDWDTSYQKSVINRKESRSREFGVCKHFGVCNQHSSAFDLHKVFVLLFQRRGRLPPQLLEFIINQYGNKSSEDANANLLKRHLVCKFGALNMNPTYQFQCRADTLCNVVVTKDPDTNEDRYVCDGPWIPQSLAISDIRHTFVNFIQTFSNDSTFKIRTLANFDFQFLPGTYNWMNYVFALTRKMLITNKEAILDNYKKYMGYMRAKKEKEREQEKYQSPPSSRYSSPKTTITPFQRNTPVRVAASVKSTPPKTSPKPKRSTPAETVVINQ